MLHEFLTTHRDEIIKRCSAKVARRMEPPRPAGALDHGVPLFLEQLVETLRIEQTTTSRSAEASPTPAPTEIGRAAALHGAELLRIGYTVDQVVHDYGDVCQSVTALAVEEEKIISNDEFRTLNRCLDNAIADAVASFGSGRQTSIDSEAATLQQRLVIFADEQRRLVDIAIQSFAAIKTGSVGLTGATGTLLVFALDELRTLPQRTLPEIRISSPAAAVAPLPKIA
jgi:hypothetical protein